jgi:hypothetical protein
MPPENRRGKGWRADGIPPPMLPPERGSDLAREAWSEALTTLEQLDRPRTDELYVRLHAQTQAA